MELKSNKDSILGQLFDRYSSDNAYEFSRHQPETLSRDEIV